MTKGYDQHFTVSFSKHELRQFPFNAVYCIFPKTEFKGADLWEKKQRMPPKIYSLYLV